MGLIPTDVGVNLRTQVDSPLRSASPVSEVPSDLPDLRLGQRFSATIQQVLPDATYKALVAGKSITLSLNEGAKAGDTLELVVVDKTPQALLARVSGDSPAATASGGAYPYTSLTPAGRLIGALLPAAGESPQPVALNQGQPLMPAAAMDESLAASQLASQLQKSVSESGLFYEAHQAKWVAGQLPTESLIQEPQNRLVPRQAPLTAAVLPTPKEVLRLQPSPVETPGSGGAQVSATPAPATPPAQPPVPEELRSLVQQQLDTASTQRMVWHGEVWPQQGMDWEIKRDAPQRNGQQDYPSDAWTSRLALTMPHLGRVEATLELRGNGLSIVLQASADSTDTLRQELPSLTSALEAAGLAPLAIQVRHPRDG